MSDRIGFIKKIIFSAAVLVLCSVLSADELEYVLGTGDMLAWTVQRVFPGNTSRNPIRLMTNPALNHPPVLSRLSVFRGKELLGFVRMRQSYRGGCTVGSIGRSMDPSKINVGDLLRSFKIAAREKVSPRKLRSRERRRIERAVSELGHDTYGVREKATESLKLRGKEVLPFVKGLCESGDPEIRIRANGIFDSIMNKERIIEPDLAAVLMRATGQNKPMDKRGFLGISMSDVEKGARPGTLVLGVVEDMPAEKIGLRAGDIILSVDGEVLNGSIDLLEIISGKDSGSCVKLVIKRKEEEMEIKVELTGRPVEQAVIRR